MCQYRLTYTPIGKATPVQLNAVPVGAPVPSTCFYGLSPQGQRLCFIKTPHLGTTAEYVRFQHECHARDQSSPYVVDCLGLGWLSKGDGASWQQPAIVYEYAPSSLRKFLDRFQPSPAQCGEILLKLLRALLDIRYRASEAAEITHADMKPDNVLMNYTGCDPAAPWPSRELMVKLTDFDIASPAHAQGWLHASTYPYSLGFTNRAANSAALDLCPYLVTMLELLIAAAWQPGRGQQAYGLTCKLAGSLPNVFLENGEEGALCRRLIGELTAGLALAGLTVGGWGQNSLPQPLLAFICQWLARLWLAVRSDSGQELDLRLVYSQLAALLAQTGQKPVLGAVLQRQPEYSWFCLLREDEDYFPLSAKGQDYRRITYWRSQLPPLLQPGVGESRFTGILRDSAADWELYLNNAASGGALELTASGYSRNGGYYQNRLRPGLFYQNPSTAAPASRNDFQRLEVVGYSAHPGDGAAAQPRAASLRLPAAQAGDGCLNLVLLNHFLPPDCYNGGPRQAWGERQRNLGYELIRQIDQALVKIGVPARYSLAQIGPDQPEDGPLRLLPLGQRPVGNAEAVIGVFHSQENHYARQWLYQPTDGWPELAAWTEAPAGKTLLLALLHQPSLRPATEYAALLGQLPRLLLGEGGGSLWAADGGQAFFDPDLDYQGQARLGPALPQKIGPWLELCVNPGSGCILSPLSEKGLQYSRQWEGLAHSLAMRNQA